MEVILCKKNKISLFFCIKKTQCFTWYDITDKYELTFYVGRIPLVHKIDRIHKCDTYDMIGIGDMNDKTYKSDRSYK